MTNIYQRIVERGTLDIDLLMACLVEYANDDMTRGRAKQILLIADNEPILDDLIWIADKLDEVDVTYAAQPQITRRVIKHYFIERLKAKLILAKNNVAYRSRDAIKGW